MHASIQNSSHLKHEFGTRQWQYVFVLFQVLQIANCQNGDLDFEVKYLRLNRFGNYVWPDVTDISHVPLQDLVVLNEPLQHRSGLVFNSEDTERAVQLLARF